MRWWWAVDGRTWDVKSREGRREGHNLGGPRGVWTGDVDLLVLDPSHLHGRIKALHCFSFSSEAFVIEDVGLHHQRPSLVCRLCCVAGGFEEQKVNDLDTRVCFWSQGC